MIVRVKCDESLVPFQLHWN